MSAEAQTKEARQRAAAAQWAATAADARAADLEEQLQARTCLSADHAALVQASREELSTVREALALAEARVSGLQGQVQAAEATVLDLQEQLAAAQEAGSFAQEQREVSSQRGQALEAELADLQQQQVGDVLTRRWFPVVCHPLCTLLR